MYLIHLCACVGMSVKPLVGIQFALAKPRKLLCLYTLPLSVVFQILVAVVATLFGEALQTALINIELMTHNNLRILTWAKSRLGYLSMPNCGWHTLVQYTYWQTIYHVKCCQLLVWIVNGWIGSGVSNLVLQQICWGYCALNCMLAGKVKK